MPFNAMTHTPPHLASHDRLHEMQSHRLSQVLHGRRQPVLCSVRLNHTTGVTLSRLTTVGVAPPQVMRVGGVRQVHMALMARATGVPHGLDSV
jgi:hypothetical protein